MKTKISKTCSELNAAKMKIGYIVSLRLDFWLTGGISILVMSFLLLYLLIKGQEAVSITHLSWFGGAFIFHTLINWPHFMASYGLLYRPLNNIQSYKVATIYLPLLLVSIVFISVMTSGRVSWSSVSVNQDIAYLIWLVAAFYLAWHYTGQAWGMISTFSVLSAIKLTFYESLFIRSGLRLLLLWHVVWGAQDLPPHWFGGLINDYHAVVFQFLNIACCISFALGIGVWLKIAGRINRIPDARIIASWLSIYLWYFTLYFMPEAYILVQLSHSLQYLGFPYRVELNARLTQSVNFNKAKQLNWSVAYYVLLVLSGLAVFWLPESISRLTEKYPLAIVIASCVSIHHYYVDSCIWKISNPIARSKLFKHLA